MSAVPRAPDAPSAAHDASDIFARVGSPCERGLDPVSEVIKEQSQASNATPSLLPK